MIKFRCSCGQGLQVPESEAGGSVQCTRCGRLRSVPYLEELGAMEEDGTIRIAGDASAAGGSTQNAAPVPHRPPRTADFPTFFETGGVDRRSTLQEILRIGTAEESPAQRPVRPRYDPETGELVRELDLAEPIPVKEPAPAQPPATPHFPELREATAADPSGPAVLNHSVPLIEAPAAPKPAAQASARTLSYAQGSDYGRRGSGQPPIPLHIRPVYWYSIPLELLQPANVMVLGFVFFVHLLIQGLGLLTIMGALPLGLVAIGLWLILLAHYVAVIDETGPEGRDEMPGILRNVSLSDDLLVPLWALLTAIALCFGPSAALVRAAGWGNLPDAPTLVAALVLAGIGFLFFPATLLTAATSGSIMNLAPQRIFGVVLAAPLKYLLALPLLGLTLATYAVGLGAVGLITSVGAGWNSATKAELVMWSAAGYLALFAGIYFAHAFAWLLGKIYQQHHHQFPWVLQRHVSNRTDPTKQLERQRAAQILAHREEQARSASRHVRARLASKP